MLRADTGERFASYAVARQRGWLSVNEIRALENLPPIEGGDTDLQPLNMEPARPAAPPEARAATVTPYVTPRPGFARGGPVSPWDGAVVKRASKSRRVSR